MVKLVILFSKSLQYYRMYICCLFFLTLRVHLTSYTTRYLPLLAATFTFPQSLGILGGRPGASTYLVGVQDDKVFYLDPHEVQQVRFIYVCFCVTIFHYNNLKDKLYGVLFYYFIIVSYSW